MSARFQPLPHVYPFRFVDRILNRRGDASGRVRAVITGDARAVNGTAFSPMLLGELLAQAALLLDGSPPDVARSGFLAGFQELLVERMPEPGDILTAEVAPVAVLGPVARFEGSLFDDADRLVARAAFTVRKGTTTVPVA